MSFLGERIRVIQKDALSGLKELPDESVDLGVTSPPYWKKRDYKSLGQLGQEKTYRQYIDHILEITQEMKRVLKPTGSLWLNIADSYSKASDDIDDGSLLGIPQRIFIKMLDDQGWLSENWITWDKPNHSPGPWLNRFTNAYEPFMWFVKSKRTRLWWFKETGQWVTKKPDMPQAEYEIVPNVLTKGGKQKRKKTKTNYYGFRYYFDLDPIRVPVMYPYDVKRRKEQDRKDGILPFAKDNDQGIPWRRDLPQYKTQMEYRKKLWESRGITDTNMQFSKEKRAEYKGKFDGTGLSAEDFGSPRARNERRKLANSDTELGMISAQKRADMQGIPGGAAMDNPKGKNPSDTWFVEKDPDLFVFSVEEHRTGLSIEKFRYLSTFATFVINQLENIACGIDLSSHMSYSTSGCELISDFIQEFFRAGEVQPNLSRLYGIPYATITVKQSSDIIAIEFGWNRYIFFSGTLSWLDSKLNKIPSKRYAVNTQSMTMPFSILINLITGIELSADIINQFNILRSKAYSDASTFSKSNTSIRCEQPQDIGSVMGYGLEIFLVESMLSILSEQRTSMFSPSFIVHPAIVSRMSFSTTNDTVKLTPSTQWNCPRILKIPEEYKGNLSSDIWKIATYPYRGLHFAVFPFKLIYPIVVSCCPPGGTVCDPFNGSGTSAEVSELLLRNYIGFEINPYYIQLTWERINTIRNAAKDIEKKLKKPMALAFERMNYVNGMDRFVQK